VTASPPQHRHALESGNAERLSTAPVLLLIAPLLVGAVLKVCF
jgi:hypothetical protein